MKNLHLIASALKALADNIEDLEETNQQFSSKGTAINWKSGRLPAIFRLVHFPGNSMVLDYGGGTTESQELANNFLKSINSEDLVYDPFNRTRQENDEVLRKIRKNGGADVAICSNVLNVIAEESARISVLKNIKRLTKPGAPVYFTVYEGNNSGVGRQTDKDQYQNNKKTADYIGEIEQVFSNVKRHGKLIEARS